MGFSTIEITPVALHFYSIFKTNGEYNPLVEWLQRLLNPTVQTTKHINSIISTPVSSETVRRVLRKNSFKAVVKKKKPLLSVRHCYGTIISNLFFYLSLQSYLIKSHDSAAPQYCAAAYISQLTHGLCMSFIIMLSTCGLPHALHMFTF